MSFLTLVTKGVALAAKLTTSLQVEVVHEAVALDAAGAVVTTAPYGEVSYAGAVTRSALWEDEAQVMRLEGGLERMSTGKLTFLEAGLRIDQRDRLTLPDGTQPAILRTEGLRTSAGAAYLVVWLGASESRTGGGR